MQKNITTKPLNQNNMKTYRGKIETKFFWLLPLIIGVSKSNVDDKANVYALHITPFFEIGFNCK